MSNPGPCVKEFFNAIDTNEQSALYTLCNAILRKERLTVNQIGGRVTASQLSRIISCMFNLEQDKSYLLDPTRLSSFLQFRVELLSHKLWFKSLDLGSIMTLSDSDEFIGMGLVALVRKYQLTEGQKDPFEEFDMNTLQQTGIRQNISIISGLIQSCESLPLEYFKQLGQRDIEHARLILLFLQEHPSRFDMGVFFLQCHPILKKELHTNWQQTKESTILPELSVIALDSSVMTVSDLHPEFQSISQATRAKRDLPDNSNDATGSNYAYNVLAHVRALGFNHQTFRFIAMGAVSLSMSPVLSVTSPFAFYAFGLGLWTMRAAVTPISELESTEVKNADQARISPAANA